MGELAVSCIKRIWWIN